MSEETKVISDTSVMTTAQAESNKPAELPLLYGYTVGLKVDGHFVFELLGDQRGLTELLGIHQYAALQVKKIEGEATMTGDKLAHELGAVLNLLNQKLDMILQTAQAQVQAIEVIDSK